MSVSRLPRNFYKPLAMGAPEPLRELPVRLERVIQFVPGHNEKVLSKVPDLAKQVDVVLVNLEDAIPADSKDAARKGVISVGKNVKFGSTGFWIRCNSLASPWAFDDLVDIVAEVGNQLDVVMLPKVDGPWDIHYLDQLLAQLEAKHKVKKPILIHAILETAEGVMNVDAIASASPRMHGMSFGPADLAASRGMKTTRVGGGHPGYQVVADAEEGKSGRARYQQDLSMVRSATSRIPKLAKHNSATPSCKAASARGRCILPRSKSRRRYSAPIRRRSPSPRRRSTRCPTAWGSRSWTARCSTTQPGSRPKSWSISRSSSPRKTQPARTSTTSSAVC